MTPGEPPVDPQLREAILRLLDDDLGDEEFAWLQEHLENDPAARECYFHYAWLESALDSAFTAPIARPKLTAPAVGRTARFALAVAAAVAILIAGTMFVIRTTRPEPGPALQFCGGSAWSIDGMDNHVPGELAHGTRIEITEGIAELRLRNQVRTLVEGPASITLVDDRTLQLDRGTGYFEVGPKGHGFTVVTPYQRVVDLGTEFGVRVWEGQDETELHVFKGRVEVQAPGATGGGFRQELGAVLLDGPEIVRTLAVDPASFPRSLPDRAEILLREDFEHGLIDGEVRSSGIEGWWTGRDAGIFNPNGIKWYVRDDLADNSPSAGMVQGMAGTNLGFFFNAEPGTALVREIGFVKSNTRYRASVLVGCRADRPGIGEVFDGYTLQLVSGEVVLGEVRSDDPPGPPGSFTHVSLLWNPKAGPAGITPGSPLQVRFAPNGSGRGGNRYVDFDKLEVIALDGTRD
ncbi:FecR domain-containing protein [Luteolibacter marinus]|uniref:FecR domain-containing protein n=1 Tax=Luteolibacter marinus TaxID=2776705 RepID=UPI001866A136|nr:FecR family protein [Luteolibacter marinus]